MSANCLLISANQVVTPYPVYPLGIACLLGALTEAGHRADHYDVLSGGLEGLESRLATETYDLLAISIRNLDSVDSADSHNFLGDISRIVAVVRASSLVPIVLGGSGFSIMPEALMELLQPDYGVIGEGEKILPWLAGEIASGTPPPRRVYSQALEGYPDCRPVFQQNIADYYLAHGGMLNIQTKRGCPYNCSYCSYPLLEGRRIRYREPEEVAEEMAHLTRDLGARYIFFADSVFNDPAKRFLEIAEALIRRGNTTPWCAFFRPQNLTRDDLLLLKRAGLAAAELGTDATSDATLAAFGKGFTFADVLHTANHLSEAEIPCAHYVIFGGPDEDHHTLQEGLQNLDRLPKSVVFAFTGIRILPNTGIHDRAVSDKVISREHPLLLPTYYFSPLIERKQLETGIIQAFSGRQDRIFPCSKVADHITMLHKFGHLGPLWELILKSSP